MKVIATTSKAIFEGLLAWFATIIIGCMLNWVGFTYFWDMHGFWMWTGAIIVLFVGMPIGYFYFGFYYAQKIVFRRFYIDNHTISLSLSRLIMKQVIRVMKQNGNIEQGKLELRKILNDYIKSWPWMIRAALKTILFFIPIWDMIKELDKNKMKEELHEEVSQDLFVKMDLYIKEEFLSAFPWFSLWLVPVNVLLMYLISLLGA